MKKAFTLVELLIVVVVIAILMSVSFKLIGLAEDQTARNTTIVRMQALENAVEGYFAAFGSYPPVRLHGSRNFWTPVNNAVVQLSGEKPVEGVLNMRQVEAACRSQPMAVAYPFRKDDQEEVTQNALCAQQYANEGDGDYNKGYTNAYGTGFDALNTPDQLYPARGVTSWTDLQLFRFGLMSFLLPRYLVMMQGPDTSLYDRFAQWGDNNAVPCQFETGVPYNSWADLVNDVKEPDGQPVDAAQRKKNPNAWKVALLPSQAITARWMANFEHNLKVLRPIPEQENGKPCLKIYGVNVHDGSESFYTMNGLQNGIADGPLQWIFSQGTVGTDGGSFTQAYALDGITCVDGWGNEFFYYSLPPYQNYRIWSAGPWYPKNASHQNCATFPPWVSEKEIDDMGAQNAKIARAWRADDLVHMSN